MYEKIIETGLIFLLIYTPLAFGGVSEGSVALLELVCGGLMLVWLTKLFAHRTPFLPKNPDRRDRYQLQLIIPSVFGAFILFIAAGGLQLFPFPKTLLNRLSPATYGLYTEAAASIGTQLPAHLPLTICTQATEMEVYKLLTYAAIFWLIINNIRSPRQVKRIIYVIIAVGVFEAGYGLIEYLSGRHHIFFYQKTSSLSVSGTFANKNHFAGYMEMVVPLTFGLLFTRLEERIQTSSKTFVRFFEEKYMKAILIGFLLAIMIGALLLSGSRGGIVSFACGIFFLLGLISTRRLLRKRAVVVLVLLVFSVGAAVFIGHDLIISRFHTLTQLEQEQSFLLRQQVWADTLHIFRDFPVFGSGFGTFSHIFPQYQTFSSGLTFFYAENDYLQLLAETGVIGTLLVVLIGIIYFYTTLRAWKQRRSRWSIIFGASGVSAIFSLLVHSSIDFNLHIPSNALLFTVIAGLSFVAAHSQRHSS